MIKKILALCLAICMSIALLPAAAVAEPDTVFVKQTTYTTPSITTQPKSKTVALGETVTFKVAASGAKAYQWEYSKDNGASWTTWSGKTSASLSVKASKTNNGCLYRCVVKNGLSSVTSSKARLTVSNVKPMILTNPTNKSTNLGNEVTFRAYAGGKNVSYQWEYSKDGGSSWKTWSGKTEKNLVVKASSTNNGCLYRCKASNSYGSVRTTAAKLTVKGILSITKQPAAQKSAVGTTVSFKVEATGSNITYQWQYSKDKGKTWTNCSSTGYNKATFSFKTSRAMDQRMYRCVVTSNGVNVTSDAAKLTVPQYSALLIGEENYYNTNNYLPGPLNDIHAMKGMLGDLRAKYSVKYLPDAEKTTIMNAISSIAKSSKSYDMLVFYYSGHGANARANSGYLGALCTVEGNYITTAELANALSQYKGKVLVLLDSCFSGAAIDKSGNGNELDKFNSSVIEAFSDYTFIDESEVQEGAVARTGELKQDKFLVITAASYTQTSVSITYGDDFYFGLFTYSILDALGCRYPDGEYTGALDCSRITLGQMYDHITSVIKEFECSQQTQYYGNRNEIIFRRY